MVRFSLLEFLKTSHSYSTFKLFSFIYFVMFWYLSLLTIILKLEENIANVDAFLGPSIPFCFFFIYIFYPFLEIHDFYQACLILHNIFAKNAQNFPLTVWKAFQELWNSFFYIFSLYIILFYYVLQIYFD